MSHLRVYTQRLAVLLVFLLLFTASLPTQLALADASPNCNKFVLYTSKSYTHGTDYKYRFQMGPLSCSPHAGGMGSIPGQVTFEYWLRLNPPAGPGWLNPNQDANSDGVPDHYTSSHGFFDVTPTGGVYSVSFPNFNHLGSGITSVAGIYRAKLKGAPDSTYSQWVQVNHNTTYGLLRATDYLKVAPNTAAATFNGVNHAAGVNFQNILGYTAYNALDTSPPVTSAQATSLIYHIKSNEYGYNHTRMPWSSPGTFWSDGESNTLFWIQGPVASVNHPNNKPNDERIIVANATAFYCPPNGYKVSPENCDPILPYASIWSNWNNVNYLVNNPNWMREYGPTFMTAVGTNFPDQRNYTLLPEYVGNGWGINAVHDRLPADPNNPLDDWHAHAFIFPANQLPGFPSNDTRTILQMRLYEGRDGFLGANASSAQTGHREDWFMDSNGVIRIEGRIIGPQAGSGGEHQVQYPAVAHPDILHRQIMKYPHYCTTRANSGGSCPTPPRSVP